ncbi:BTB/POZ domain-containing protein 3-like protein [Aphelenchoides avenae]|nr:BTB/POZ domain-containing protein 3-like protein [Aphelenchus avenae]
MDTSYFVGCAGEPEIVFVSSGKDKLTYRVHNAKLAAMPEGTVLHGLAKTNFVGDNNTIILPEDVKPEGFHNLLQLLYGKKTCITAENWEATLRVAFMYTMAELEVQVANFLETSLTASMALRCLSMCQSLSVYSSSVLDACWKYVDRNGEVILRSKEFLDINHATMMRIIERDTLVVKENTVYRTAVKWARAQLDKKAKECTDEAVRVELGDALYKIRFHRGMTAEDFANGPGGSDILTTKEKSDIMMSYFREDVKPAYFDDNERACAKNYKHTAGDGRCTRCGHASEAYVSCCDDKYLQIGKEPWSFECCDDRHCGKAAYRCSCGAVNSGDYDLWSCEPSHCDNCGMAVHICSGDVTMGARPFHTFDEGEECEGCGCTSEDLEVDLKEEKSKYSGNGSSDEK